MFTYILEEIEDDRYKAMVIMKSIILMIQNGASYLDTVVKVSRLLDAEEEDEKIFYDCLKTVFLSHTYLWEERAYALGYGEETGRRAVSGDQRRQEDLGGINEAVKRACSR